MNIARLKGELFMEHSKHWLLPGNEQIPSSQTRRPLLHWGTPDLDSLLTKPLKDVSNGVKPSKSVKKKKAPENEDTVGGEALDSLLLVHSDLSALIHQVTKCIEIGLPELIFLVIFSQFIPHLMSGERHVFDRFAVIFSVVIVWIYAHLLTVGGEYKNSPMKTQLSCRTDCARLIGAAPSIRVPYPFEWGVPTFFFANLLISYVLLKCQQSTGAFIAVSRHASATPLPPSILSRGVGWQGVGILFSGIFGTGNGSSVSVENAGLLALTRVGSRRVVQISAGFMIFFSILGKFGAVFASIPAPIIAALYCLFLAYVGFGKIKLSAVVMLLISKLRTQRMRLKNSERESKAPSLQNCAFTRTFLPCILPPLFAQSTRAFAYKNPPTFKRLVCFSKRFQFVEHSSENIRISNSNFFPSNSNIRIWCGHKSKVTRKIRDVGKNSRAAALMKPDNVKSMEEWMEFVRKRCSKESKKTRNQDWVIA
ncbi:uncharacterized protein LOC132301266 [Cornus florida]|uniref:uncharacterized protein LOC132301266 n=1 Tax=Cornus florida TaxID=4283 RepID=UPI002898605A|nr:uncharacterized protein LOC132301266 [Cornus florida]